MGTAARERPEKLPKKLLQIRSSLGLSQNEMLVELELADRIDRSAISGYEIGAREPTLITLLKYARLAGVHVDVLIDDETDLPKKFLR
ncbi:MAG TPA: helix-turn-helix transcriptional regulator [Pyrinomonadaceae bacterium]|jgi:transcriptional regulator with XRE-family HTH domain|nr:helix-turn-helix transcriptional regulator [Pyrinomonadaceae bacterium]